MATVREDLIDGHRLRDVRGGSSIVRTFSVTGLASTPDQQLIEAIQDPGVPKVGDQYPNSIPLFVQEVDAVPDGQNAARVQCTYSVPNRPQGGSWNQPLPIGRDGQDVKAISFGVREQSSTTRDRDGQPMTLNVPSSASAWGKPYLSEATVLRPVGSVVFERVETSPPSDRVRGHVGTTNSGAVGAYLANQLLFRAFEAYSDDGGQTWNCTYTFDYDVDGWKHTDTWKEESTGLAPTDAVQQEFDVLYISNYALLGLDFTDGQTPL